MYNVKSHKNRKTMKKLLFAIFAAALIISGCNKTETTDKPGRLSVKITDDPLNLSSVESATVTISRIEIRKAGADETDKFLELLITPVTIDISELSNGITKELVNLEIPKGDYDLVRLIVDEANLKIEGISEIFNMKVPSGEQTGIKVFIDPVIHVEEGISAELLLDFDLSRSFVMKGHNARNGFNFKPCIRATNISTSGRIEGYVKDNSPVNAGIEDASVAIQKGDEDTLFTITDANGHYAFIGVSAGTYSVSATMENYEASDVESVVVFAGNKVTHNIILRNLPVYVSSSIENSTAAKLEITYSLALANIVPDPSAFTVTVNTVARSVSSVVVSEQKVTLTLSSAVVKGDVVTVAYTRPGNNPLQSADGLQAPSFSSQIVTNNVN